MVQDLCRQLVFLCHWGGGASPLLSREWSKHGQSSVPGMVFLSLHRCHGSSASTHITQICFDWRSFDWEWNLHPWILLHWWEPAFTLYCQNVDCVWWVCYNYRNLIRDLFLWQYTGQTDMVVVSWLSLNEVCSAFTLYLLNTLYFKFWDFHVWTISFIPYAAPCVDLSRSTIQEGFYWMFSVFLSEIYITYDWVIILEYFNINVCCPEKPIVNDLIDVINSFGLIHVLKLECSHTLDLVLS